MQTSRQEVLEELNLTFISQLNKGDSFKVKSANKKADIVQLKNYNNLYITFIFDGEKHGIFWKEVRDNEVKIIKAFES